MAILALPARSQNSNELSVKAVMNTLVTPATNTLWGAYDISTDAQWQTLDEAARTVIQAGELIATGGSGPEDMAEAANEDWQRYTRAMIEAGQAALSAIQSRNEQALSDVGNDLLYPPCESCHARYMAQ